VPAASQFFNTKDAKDAKDAKEACADPDPMSAPRQELARAPRAHTAVLVSFAFLVSLV